MANQYSKENPPNICFDCANAYADKCPYIRSRKVRIIRRCVRFVPDTVRVKIDTEEAKNQMKVVSDVEDGRKVGRPRKLNPVEHYDNLSYIASKLHYSKDRFAHMSLEQKIQKAKEQGYTLEVIDKAERCRYRLIKNETPPTD